MKHVKKLAAVASLVTLVLAAGVSTHAQGTKKFTIGVSNGFIGSEWRTQMLDGMKAVNAEYMKQGLTNELVIQSADVDVQGQIAQIRNLINAKVNGIIIDPNSPTALNPVIKEAQDAGIMVVVVDQEVTAQGAVNVAIDQEEWGRRGAQWIADTLKGKGSIVIMNGVAGHPANEGRVRGQKSVLAKYPGIKVLNAVNGDWDQSKAQQTMSSVLASQPNIDGVLSQDGMAEGTLRAILATNPKAVPVMNGEAIAGYLRLWQATKKKFPAWQSHAVVNPPGVGPSGLRILVGMLQGKKLRDGALTGPSKNTLYYPIPGNVVDGQVNGLVARFSAKTNSYVVDSQFSQAQASSYFK
ncbi:substrate-binding domain-containing protein [Deinococcus sp.]|uniref:substrate-binding domain-containing protein n=1 Tax=Deinococcus sp. TaxID=47478 RepID=UPI003CC6587C